MGNKYTIGVDYGTQSGRAVLVNLANGQEVADHVTPYRHHVIDEFLPGSGKRLEHDWALQHPGITWRFCRYRCQRSSSNRASIRRM